MLLREKSSSSGNSRTGPHVIPETYLVLKERRRSPLPRQAVRHSFQRVNLSKPHFGASNEVSGNYANWKELRLEAIGVRHEASRPRRLLFDGTQGRQDTSTVAVPLPVGCQPLVRGRGKRSFPRSIFEGRGYERPMKKHKPFDVDNNLAAGKEVKSKRSRENAGRKFRRLDSIERNEIVGGDSLRGEQSREACEIEGGGRYERVNGPVRRSSGHFNEHSCHEKLEVAAQIDTAEGLEVRRAGSRYKAEACGAEELSDDWTQEHLQEHHKTQRRKSLEDLQSRERPFLSWTRKAKRRSRTGLRNASGAQQGVEMAPSVNKFDNMYDAEGLRLHVSLGESMEFIQEDVHHGTNNSIHFQVNAKERPGDILHKEADIPYRTLDCLEQGMEARRKAFKEEFDSREIAGNIISGEMVSQAVVSVHCKSLANETSQDAVEWQINLGQTLESLLELTSDETKIKAVGIPESDRNVLKCIEPLSEPTVDKMKGAAGIEKGGTDPGPLSEEAIHQLVTAVDGNGIVERSIAQIGEADDSAHFKEGKTTCLNDDEVKLNLAEGRRCGLCGGGSDGEPPHYLLPVSTKQEEDQASGRDEMYSGYSDLDAFANEPGWLGRLLGPLSDRFGIAGVWVHQECAVWSPEVYFAGVGHLKNVRAALRRGRLLKCSRCGKPGATIGCRVDRCPRTYHLPCGRFEGCFFDHKKYLMACLDHLNLFLPRLPGSGHCRTSKNVEMMRFKRMAGERKKAAKEASQKDLEVEEKWLENAGEDEEFVRRERRRLQRDLARIAPVFVGGSDGKQFVDDWKSVAGLENVVQCMKEMVILPLLYPEIFNKLGVTPPRGVLLHGHPGTGKTLAVRALVGACAKGDKRIAYFARKGADCLGKYVGDAERQLRLLFHVAEQHQPSIIFFDEIDGLAPMRSQHQDQTQKSVVSTLLALMDGLKSRGSVIVIGATNRPDALDPALRRPGRFDREIYFPLPSTADRTAILALLTSKWQMPPTNDVLSLLARHTKGFAGADLQALCAQAAIVALKRISPIEGLLDIVEKKGVDELPPLPSLSVKLIDWAAALEQVSPPCSWRTAKAAINEVPSVPLPQYMVPALLWPMVEILVSLHLDARVTLPPVLEKAAITVEAALQSAVEGGSCGSLMDFSWLACLSSSLRCTTTSSYREKLEKALENALSKTGMISDVETGRHDFSKLKWQLPYNGSRFRVMVSGNQMSGQNFLAAWFLYGFEGFAEMCNLSLPTMLQEGGGDVIQGLIQILGNVRSICPCVVFMPQIETWAVENADDSWGENQRLASQSWNVFLQQVNTMPANLSIVFLGFCEIPKNHLPLEIVKFFSGNLSDVGGYPSSSSRFSDYFCFDTADHGAKPMWTQEPWLSCCRSIPCSWVQISPFPDIKVVFGKAAHDFAEAFASRFLRTVNRSKRSSQSSYFCTGNSVTYKAHVDSPVLQQFTGEESLLKDCRENRLDYNLSKEEELDLENESLKSAAIASEKATVSCDINCTQMGFHPASQEQLQILSCSNQESERPSGATERESAELWLPQQKLLSVSITTLGYQLLYHPLFMELRHATSKLKEGPFVHMRRHDKSASCGSGDGSNSQRDPVDDSLVLKGLVAVGLLAYNGMYVTSMEVAWGVRKVLELLMEKINLKVSLGKDRLQFLHLLSQAASLEDKVFAWAHELQSLETGAKVPRRLVQSVGPDMLKFEELSPDIATRSAQRGKEFEEAFSVHDVPPYDLGTPCTPVCSNLEAAINEKRLMVKDGSDVSGASLYCFDQPGLKGMGTCISNDISSGSHGLQGYVTNEQDNKASSGRQDDKLMSIKTDLQKPESRSALGDLEPTLEIPDKNQPVPCTVAIVPSQKCCPECLLLVEHALRKLFLKCWRHRGSNVSLSVAHDVIGTCSAAITVALNQPGGIVDGVKKMDEAKDALKCSASFCECKTNHKLGITVSSHSTGFCEAVNGSDKGRVMDGAQFADLTPVHNTEISENLVFMCLCPLLKVILDLNRPANWSR